MLHGYDLAMRMVFALFALLLGCSPDKDEGGKCDKDSDCLGELMCVEKRCSVSPALHQQMASQSGAEVAIERKAAPANAAGAVRVRSASGREFVFAVCSANERLIGGWCTPAGSGGESASFTRSAIKGHSETDTIGAQWTCTRQKAQLTAFALCQRVD